MKFENKSAVEILSEADLSRMRIELMNSEQAIDFHEALMELINKIRKKFPDDYMQYRFYHFLVGSGIDQSQVKIEIKADDFPGEYSISNFLEKEYGKLKEEA